MNCKYIIRFILYFQSIICTASLYSQDNISNYNSRAFGYNIYGSVAPLGPFKMFLNSPVITNLSPDPLADNYIAGASFASDGKLYGIRYGSNMLVKIDTTTGVITNIGYSGPGTGMAFDWVTNTMYMMTYTNVSQLNTVNLSNGTLTPIGQPYNGCIEDIGYSNKDNLYGIEILFDKFVSINKITGEVLPIGPLGFNAGYNVGMSWDHMSDSCFVLSYNNQTNKSEMRKVNVQNGSSALLYSIDAQTDGLAIPGAPYPAIEHVVYGGNENPNGSYPIGCAIYSSGFPIDTSKTKVYWSRNNPVITDSSFMIKSGIINWVGIIPGNGTTATYRYYIKTTNTNGTTVSPYGAPAVLYSFFVGPDTVKPVINYTPVNTWPKEAWPAAIFAYVTDNIGLDSVWVRWHKNNSPLVKQFKLNIASGDLYSGEFNSDKNEVSLDDSITYRIIAQDNSSNHNKDSTQNYFIKINNNLGICVGTRNTIGNSPFNNQYYNSKADLLYKKSELVESGGSQGYIGKIGFLFYQSKGKIENLQIKMKNTALTNITEFSPEGWTTVFNGTYNARGQGYDFIGLQIPFYWNGVSNLLLEFCYQNSAVYDTLNELWAMNYVGMNINTLSNTDPGCSLNGPTPLTSRPIICLKFVQLNGYENSSTAGKYSLEQNYPNPFNPITKIKYSIASTSHVKLTIYDLLGREVTALVNEVKETGSYYAEFNGSNLASGVYFYLLEAGDFIQCKKMVLIK